MDWGDVVSCSESVASTASITDTELTIITVMLTYTLDILQPKRINYIQYKIF